MSPTVVMDHSACLGRSTGRTRRGRWPARARRGTHRQETYVRRLLLAATGAITLVAAGLGTVTAQAAAPAAAAAAGSAVTTRAVCGTPARGQARCLALKRTDTAATTANQRMASALSAARAAGRAAAASTPSGLGPAQIQSAYKLTGLTSGGRTVAIVDAYDDPNAEADLATYRSQYGLPACTTANGCFKQGQPERRHGTLPGATDAGWAEEISLDLDMVSRHLPRLPHPAGRGQLRLHRRPRRRRQHRRAPRAPRDQQQLRRQRRCPTLLRRAPTTTPASRSPRSTGDSGYGVAVPGVLAVRHRGRRHLAAARPRTPAAGPRPRGRGAGSGCSRYNAALSAASHRPTPAAPSAPMADVSAVADPTTGVAVYDTTAFQRHQGLARLRRHQRLVADHRRRSTRWPATTAGVREHLSRTATRARSST